MKVACLIEYINYSMFVIINNEYSKEPGSLEHAMFQKKGNLINISEEIIVTTHA